ncbi:MULTISPECIES: 4-hydroxyphenylpyruvate dioxygenase [Spirulina sp. CCY15215]|uniref:4-hydroxyphenylpyruvate dioxygenase n=1 Tax=Spirulina sp. CCY15215 TaxID=2767591 RepID=UPI00194F474E|nr:4-hydroxyphenylpyruvate dioxygenase [Spirulina major]
MKIERICFYVEDAKQWRDWFVKVMGFMAIASSHNSHTQTEIIRSGAIVFSLSSPLTQSSPVANYLKQHPPGVADVSFTVANLAAILTKVEKYGGTILTPIQKQGDRLCSQIQSKIGITHTLFSAREKPSFSNHHPVFFEAIDHVVFNVETGQLKKIINWYKAVFGFECQQTFNIQTARSGLLSQVMVHPESGIKIPINEPTSINSQIQEFLNENNGSGVQHIALKTHQILHKIAKLRAAGVNFLDVPLTYYRQLRSQSENLLLSEQEFTLLEQQKILIDRQSSLQENMPFLLQIFTKPIFSRPTFFFEFIERHYQAEGFGEGNFRALFEAIEREQIERESKKIEQK